MGFLVLVVELENLFILLEGLGLALERRQNAGDKHTGLDAARIELDRLLSLLQGLRQSIGTDIQHRQALAQQRRFRVGCNRLLVLNASHVIVALIERDLGGEKMPQCTRLGGQRC